MPLPSSDVNRTPLHTRSITVNSFAREDGQWDLEAELIDTKSYSFNLQSGGVRKAGEPIHHMHLRVTINEELTVTDAVAAYDAAPYGVHCTSIESAYKGLVGLNLLRNFRNEVRKRFSRVAGCTHMTELAYVLPTTAVQTMAGQSSKQFNPSDKEKQPFQLEGCHALRLDSMVTKKFYPKWYIQPADNSDSK